MFFKDYREKILSIVIFFLRRDNSNIKFVLLKFINIVVVLFIFLYVL